MLGMVYGEAPGVEQLDIDTVPMDVPCAGEGIEWVNYGGDMVVLPIMGEITRPRDACRGAIG
jgi:hypothetical protein